MIDKLLKFGSIFDWISPVKAAIDDHVKGPGVGFRVPVGIWCSGAQLRRGLKKIGVQSWGWMIVDDVILFDVPRDQARSAENFLEGAQIPFNTWTNHNDKA